MWDPFMYSCVQNVLSHSLISPFVWRLCISISTATISEMCGFSNVCMQYLCSVILHPASARACPSYVLHWMCAHMHRCVLGCECAFEYLIAFLSHSRVAELTTKLRRHNYLLSTADLLVKQLLRTRHRMRLPSSGQLCILRSCLLSLTREFRDRRLLGGAGGAGRWRGVEVLSPARARILCAGNRVVFFCWGQRETMSCSRGKIDFSFHNHCCCLWFFFFRSFLYYFFLAHLCSIYWPFIGS